MKHFFLFITCSLLCHFVYAQDAPDTLRRPTQRFEIGLNVTNTLLSFIGKTSTATVTDPYLLSFRIGNERRRARLGLQFGVQNKTDETTGTKFITKGNTVHLRAGYEWAYPMAGRFAFYWGLDGVFEYSLEKVDAFFPGGSSTLTTRSTGIGAGPALGISWRIHKGVSLTTESSIYAIYHKGREKLRSIPDFSDKPFHDFIWQPLLPTSLFINFAF